MQQEQIMGNKILVTGASGNIGSALVNELRRPAPILR